MITSLNPVIWSDPMIPDADQPIQVSCNPSSGEILDTGETTTVMCTASKNGDELDSCTFTVTVGMKLMISKNFKYLRKITC